ncbi:MAG: SPFH domain-containing protein [Gemmatimonadetes bacterium]|nr:SPFH domain-containing protein [Gemmatimonadota bacterium]
MNIGKFIKKQFIDVIEWTESDDVTLAWRFPMEDNEIQYGGQLTVRETQRAMFVNEGKAADVLGPGMHTLETQNIPLLTSLRNWDKLFKSPFKSDVYFFSTRTRTNQKWGTQNPVTVRDKDFGAVRLRAFGIYSWHLADPAAFFAKLSGTRDVFTVADIEGQLRNTIVASVSAAFAQSGVPFLDMAANTPAIADAMTKVLTPTFAEMGLALDSFLVENVSLPEELQKVLDQRIQMNMVGNLDQYMKFQVAQSIPAAAANPGGGGIAGMGAGLAAGMGIGNQMANALGGALNPQPPAAPPAAPPAPPADGGTKPQGS